VDARRERVTVLQIVVSGLLSVLLAVAVNVATGGELPAPVQPFAWLAWPAVALLALTLTGLTLWQHRLGRPAAAAPEPRPAQLPAPRPLVGRAGELRAVGAAAREGGSTVLITGVPGAGKTALALRAAYDLVGRYPDGQLYFDLRGSDTDAVPPEVVLVGFLRALGDPDPAPGGGTAELAARFRTAVAGRRLLVLLDDAGTDDQVAPLLPGAGGSFVLVTSRRQLRPPGARLVRLGERASGSGHRDGAAPG
jgi:hypothetical protein